MILISKQPMARVTFGNALYTPWKRWFAWYPVTDMAVTYWLVWVEWRHCRSSAFIAGHWLCANYIEYQRPGTMTRVRRSVQ